MDLHPAGHSNDQELHGTWSLSPRPRRSSQQHMHLDPRLHQLGSGSWSEARVSHAHAVKPSLFDDRTRAVSSWPGETGGSSGIPVCKFST